MALKGNFIFRTKTNVDNDILQQVSRFSYLRSEAACTLDKDKPRTQYR